MIGDLAMLGARPVIVQLSCGLGNQMFQYAFGRWLAARHGWPVRFDRWTGFPPGGRRYALDAFALDLALADHDLARRLGASPPWRAYNRLAFVLARAGIRPPGPVRLDGFWQDWRFPEAVRPELERAFRFRRELGGPGRALAAQIAAEPEPVAVHVRRGDFVGRARFDLCKPAYFLRAIEWMRHHVRDARPVVFSDDVAFCEVALSAAGADVMYVPADVADVDALALMARCRHHVIPNSTFSWWGAWLARHPAQRVVVPDTWAPDRAQSRRDMHCLVRPGWVPLRAT